MNYSKTVEFLFNSFPPYQTVGAGAYKEGLGSITEMCRVLDNPQRNYLTIHVAGTNGKGSVAHTLASILEQAGYCVGLYTSPHLNDFRERIRVDGEMISEKKVVKFVDKNKEKMVELQLSFFEMTTALAFEHFSDSNVEVAVIETGLGGRLDATNIIKPILSIITNIGLDHTQFLGDTIEKIAQEKAGIIKKDVPVVVGESGDESDPVFIETASSAGSSLVFADKDWSCLEIEHHPERVRYTIQHNIDGRLQNLDSDLKGYCQEKNILTIRAAVHALRHHTQLNISTRALLSGTSSVCASTGLKGRWQIISDAPFTVCDTAHNAAGLYDVIRQIRAQKYNKLYIVFGIVRDKDLSEILPLLPRHAYYFFTQPSGLRAMPAETFTNQATEAGLSGEICGTVAESYKRAQGLATDEDMIFVGGSSFVVADLLEVI